VPRRVFGSFGAERDKASVRSARGFHRIEADRIEAELNLRSVRRRRGTDLRFDWRVASPRPVSFYAEASAWPESGFQVHEHETVEIHVDVPSSREW
jgi:hypothetical protein